MACTDLRDGFDTIPNASSSWDVLPQYASALTIIQSQQRSGIVIYKCIFVLAEFKPDLDLASSRPVLTGSVWSWSRFVARPRDLRHVVCVGLVSKVYWAEKSSSYALGADLLELVLVSSYWTSDSMRYKMRKKNCNRSVSFYNYSCF